MLRTVFDFFFLAINIVGKCQAVAANWFIALWGKHVLRRGHGVPGEMKDVLDVSDTPLGPEQPLARSNKGVSMFFGVFFLKNERKKTHTNLKSDGTRSHKLLFNP